MSEVGIYEEVRLLLSIVRRFNCELKFRAPCRNRRPRRRSATIRVKNHCFFGNAPVIFFCHGFK